MPMYQYACETCGQPFEKKLRMSQSDEQQTCPYCESDNTRKRLGAVAVSNGSSGGPALRTAPVTRSPFT